MVCNPLTTNLTQSPQSRPGHCSRTQSCLVEHNHTSTNLCSLTDLLTPHLKNTNCLSQKKIFQLFFLSLTIQLRGHPFFSLNNQSDFECKCVLSIRMILIEWLKCFNRKTWMRIMSSVCSLILSHAVLPLLSCVWTIERLCLFLGSSLPWLCVIKAKVNFAIHRQRMLVCSPNTDYLPVSKVVAYTFVHAPVL